MSLESFDGGWLALREPIDHRARSRTLENRLVEFLSNAEPLRVVDLGSGRGSNLRHLAPRLGRPQHWTLIDHDAGLLAQARAQLPEEPMLEVQTRVLDLADPRIAFREPVDLITASALLDLVSERWIDRLVESLSEHRLPALLALSVTGERGFLDANGAACDQDEDRRLCAAFNQHQRRPKGLGEQALGPDAIACTAGRLETAGFTVLSAASDWVLDPIREGDRALALALLDDWASAIASLESSDAALVADWRDRRRQALADGGLGLRVGHVDLLALPPA
ncbi:class I SAM-dependent methyltransferase [Wenzhouxiangella marina]|uniref:Glycosyl transferase, group 1 n=1 Tax=Wenzhouxiangella marina TaxID=1579979 RepID=A0A0K0Y035_9GAMM|nr:class I SAM-dependent methyltransferase [Wenzhouxiangella marina]AKS43299.1 Glycosyl transferase, group 1 [Wenzhouxiangella marina]MBB6087011.1 SAM-dependent methyltransferase [Wenzhouxiangella marina]